MRHFLLHLCRFAAACGLIFLTLVFITVLIQLPVNFDGHQVVIPLVSGFAGGLIFFVFVSRVPVLYVFGHEMTHWLVAKCFLRKTGSIKIGVGRGHVQVERPNLWIVLAPYFVPLYALVWVGAYGVGQMIFGTPRPGVAIGFNIGLGITYAYHLKMTAYALSRAQSDLNMHGVFFSLSLIICFNIALLLFCLIVASAQWGEGVRLTRRYFYLYGEVIVSGGAWVAREARSLFH